MLWYVGLLRVYLFSSGSSRLLPSHFLHRREDLLNIDACVGGMRRDLPCASCGSHSDTVKSILVVTTLDIGRANKFMHEIAGTDIVSITFPVVGGRVGPAIIPHFSQDAAAMTIARGQDFRSRQEGAERWPCRGGRACHFSSCFPATFRPASRSKGPGMLLDPVFYGISAVHRKVAGAPTPRFLKTSSPRQLMG